MKTTFIPGNKDTARKKAENSEYETSDNCEKPKYGRGLRTRKPNQRYLSEEDEDSVSGSSSEEDEANLDNNTTKNDDTEVGNIVLQETALTLKPG